jgi:hypothetical protein
MLMQNFFKSTGKTNFMNLLSGEKKDYAQDLLLAVIEKETYCMELIEPKLKNWGQRPCSTYRSAADKNGSLRTTLLPYYTYQGDHK